MTLEITEIEYGSLIEVGTFVYKVIGPPYVDVGTLMAPVQDECGEQYDISLTGGRLVRSFG